MIIDFETYSEAELTDIGAAAYSEHPSTRVLSLAYGTYLWVPGMSFPEILLAQSMLESWNSMFEYQIWENVCHKRMGWPRMPLKRFYCIMARSRAYALPGKLENAGKVLGLSTQKNPLGKKIIAEHSVLNNLKKCSTTLADMYEYNMQDVAAETEASLLIPQLSKKELEIWSLDQRINNRGVYIDQDALRICQKIAVQTSSVYTERLKDLTHGKVQTTDELKKFKEWLSVDSLTAEAVSHLLASSNLSPEHREALEIRKALGSKSVTKLDAISQRLCVDGRIRGLFSYCGASRTGRWSGYGPQPQNLPRGHIKNVDEALIKLKQNQIPLNKVFETISGCLRGLFSAAPGHTLICSDYSAIEAIALSELAGEKWRQEVFQTHGKIYEMAASKITGIPFERFIEHKNRTGEHLPERNQIGKIAELASGYGGGVAAWKRAGASEFLTDAQIALGVKTWRLANPCITKFWRTLEHSAITALQNPGIQIGYYQYAENTLRCFLPSERILYYHSPKIIDNKILFMGWNSNPMQGKIGWVQLDTWGGKLAENITQAVCRDVLANAMLQLDPQYPIVIHVHDEIVSEAPIGFGSITEFENIMNTLPTWCKEWPIKAKGGWSGRRYRKE